MYLVHLLLVYSSVMLSLSGVRKLGLNYSKGSVHFRRKKEQRKEDDLNLVSVIDHTVRYGQILC